MAKSKTLSIALATTLLLSPSTVLASSPSAISEAQENSILTEEIQLLEKEGYTVEVLQSEDGYSYVNAYKPIKENFGNSTLSFTDTNRLEGSITPYAAIGTTTFNVKNTVYYGVTNVGEMTGTITVTYNGSTPTISSFKLTPRARYGLADAGSGVRSGNKLTYKCTFNLQFFTAGRPVPFTFVYTATSSGGLTFFNSLSAK